MLFLKRFKVGGMLYYQAHLIDHSMKNKLISITQVRKGGNGSGERVRSQQSRVKAENEGTNVQVCE